MSQLKKGLKTVAKDLKRLTQKTDKMIKRLEKLEKKAQVAKKPKAKAVKKAVAKKPTLSAGETVLAIVKRSRKGIDKATLIKKTGFEGRKIWDIIYRLKKEGKIKSAGRGLYVKA
jgi:predicted Rossmann fold nucleotide-binding protein DprA/Smf involved in DNA uptake